VVRDEAVCLVPGKIVPKRSGTAGTKGILDMSGVPRYLTYHLAK
jgi:hypothetical protein